MLNLQVFYDSLGIGIRRSLYFLVNRAELCAWESIPL